MGNQPIPKMFIGIFNGKRRNLFHSSLKYRETNLIPKPGLLQPITIEVSQLII